MPTTILPDYLLDESADTVTAYQFFEFDLRKGKLSPKEILEFINKYFTGALDDYRERIANADSYAEIELKQHRDELAEKDATIAKLQKEIRTLRGNIKEVENALRKAHEPFDDMTSH